MDWRDGPLLAFDFETTGTDPETARIVSAAVLLIHGSTVQTRQWIVDPGVPIPAGATAIHGITSKIATTQGQPTSVAIPEILAAIHDGQALGAPLIAYNATYDLTLLDRESRRIGLTPFEGDYYVVDPLVLDRHLDRFRPGSRRLADVAAHYHVSFELGEAHGAAADALVTARIAWRLGEDPALRQMSPGELHVAQIAWAREQTESLMAYDLQRGIVRDQPYRPEWPMVPFGAESRIGGREP